MKIKSLHIDEYRHLKNIKFDFTYPKGNEKEGQPLEKICIIGQSATGKTSVLELIKNSIKEVDGRKTIGHKFFGSPYKLNFNGKIIYSFKDGDLLEMTNEVITVKNKEYINGNEGGEVNNLINEALKLIYFSSEIISKGSINVFNQNPIDIYNESSAIMPHDRLQDLYSQSGYIFEFTEDVSKEIWLTLLQKILDYKKRFNQIAAELINKGVIGDGDKLLRQYKDWSENNPNPLIPVNDRFEPLLKKLNLQIDLANTQFTIPIKLVIKDEVIPISGLSTGTKGLLLSMFPLYALDTNDALILIDEPERSLFPDIQLELINTYKNLAPNAQLIVATHSPFIAAAFEPEERFILFFNDEGNVALRKGKSPIGDDPNDMLKNDFEVDYYNKFGEDAYKRYLELKTQARDEKEPKKKKELIVKMAELGDKYNF